MKTRTTISLACDDVAVRPGQQLSPAAHLVRVNRLTITSAYLLQLGDGIRDVEPGVNLPRRRYGVAAALDPAVFGRRETLTKGVIGDILGKVVLSTIQASYCPSMTKSPSCTANPNNSASTPPGLDVGLLGVGVHDAQVARDRHDRLEVQLQPLTGRRSCSRGPTPSDRLLCSQVNTGSLGLRPRAPPGREQTSPAFMSTALPVLRKILVLRRASKPKRAKAASMWVMNPLVCEKGEHCATNQSGGRG